MPLAIQETAALFESLGCASLQDAAPAYCIVLSPAPACRVPGTRIAAPLFPVATPNDMLPCLQALDAATPGSALYIRNTGPESHALIGDIFATAALAKGLAGVVVEGAVRDLAGLRGIGLPVFSTEVTFVSAKTATCKAAALPQSLPVRLHRPAIDGGRSTEHTTIDAGDWVFGDDDGMLIVKREFVSAVVAASRVLNDREVALKTELARGTSLSDIIGLNDFLEGRGCLKSSI